MAQFPCGQCKQDGENTVTKRIKELEKQSYTEVMHERGGTYMVFDKQKFAELIVGECIDVLENRHKTFKGSKDQYGAGFKSGLNAATRTVKTYFGVEE